jgi:hypothetical protein
MAEPLPVPRKLAAILAADVAGYSRLMGADEEGTLRRLKALRAGLIDPRLPSIMAASSRPPASSAASSMRCDAQSSGRACWQNAPSLRTAVLSSASGLRSPSQELVLSGLASRSVGRNDGDPQRSCGRR